MKLETKPEIQKVFSVSTGHLSESSWLYLNNVEAHFKSLIVYPKEDYGWYVVVDSDRDYQVEDEITKGIPADIRRLLTLAQKIGCTKLDIDCDAPLYDLAALETTAV